MWCPQCKSDVESVGTEIGDEACLVCGYIIAPSDFFTSSRDTSNRKLQTLQWWQIRFDEVNWNHTQG